MVRDAGDGRFPPVNADDALDDTDLCMSALESAALLDMKLEISSDLARSAPGTIDGLRIATECPNPIANGAAASVRSMSRRCIEDYSLPEWAPRNRKARATWRASSGTRLRPGRCSADCRRGPRTIFFSSSAPETRRYLRPAFS